MLCPHKPHAFSGGEPKTNEENRKQLESVSRHCCDEVESMVLLREPRSGPTPLFLGQETFVLRPQIRASGAAVIDTQSFALLCAVLTLPSIAASSYPWSSSRQSKLSQIISSFPQLP